VLTADIWEKRFVNKVTSLTFGQAEERAALVRLSEDLLYELREGAASDRQDHNDTVFREPLAVTCVSQSPPCTSQSWL
jgi:hypothetical protein